MAKELQTGDSALTLERRRGDRRDVNAQGGDAKAGKPVIERRQKVQRRRQIDPTTCERDYTEDECEFMQALEIYKRKNGRMFPTCSEVLEVIRSLGYAKPSHATDVAPLSDSPAPAAIAE